MTTENTVTKPKQENAFLNILFNIVLPVFILNRLTKYLGPGGALVLALAFPLCYGAYDLVKRKKTNAMSILGLLNVGVTGSLAFAGLTGFWFAVKEAAFPLLVGLFVLGSAFTRKPFIETLFLNPALMKTDLLEEKLQANGKKEEFHAHLRKATMWLACSFAFSAFLNFVLAKRIFLDIDETLLPEARSVILNDQIAQMTSYSMVVIMLPSMVFLMAIFWYLLRGIKQYSGLSTDQLLQDTK